MLNIRTLTSGFAVLALAGLIVAWQGPINQGITRGLLLAFTAYERATAGLRSTPATPTMPPALEAAPAPLWSFLADHSMPVSAPAVDAAGSLYVSTRDALVALASDGKERWRTSEGLPDPVAFGVPVLIESGRIAVPGVSAVGLWDADGRARWTYTAKSDHETFVRLLVGGRGDALWFVTAESGALPGPARLVALDGSGRERWTFALGSHYPTALVPGPDDRVFMELDGKIQRFAADGTREWDGRSPDALGGHVSAAPDGGFYVVDESSIAALSPTGTVRWQTRLSDDRSLCNSSGIATASDGTLAFACNQRLHVLTPAGAPAWSGQVGQRVTTRPAFATDGTLYVGADGLYAFAPDGTPRWHTPTIFTWRDSEVPRTEASAIAAGPLVGPDGIIYAGGERNRVYAFRPDGTPRWIHALGDEDSTVWRVAQLSFLDGALLIASHGLVALPVPGASLQVVHKAATYE